jgi:hypothetical protein
LSVGPTGTNQKAYLVEFSLPFNFVVLIRVAYGSGCGNIREWIRILSNDTDPGPQHGFFEAILLQAVTEAPADWWLMALNQLQYCT